MNTTISRKNILRQLKADLIGKDSYRGVTLTYSWLANQVGHFSLGFIPTLLAYTLFKKYTQVNHPALLAASVVSAMWLLFELYNFLGPLLLSHKRKYLFVPAWKNIAFDTFTDLCFFWLGAFLSSLFIEPAQLTVIIIIAALILTLIYPSYYWYLTKMYLQNAYYPYQLRLSQCDLEISDADKKTVLQFLESKNSGKHLFVFGPQGSGKTSISVGLATEFSIKHSTCSYTTAIKLFSFFSGSDTKTISDNDVWTWRDSSLLIIDDINPGSPVTDIVTPEKFLALVDSSSNKSAVNRDIIKSKNAIWVSGNEFVDGSSTDNWMKILENIGVAKQDVTFINLQKKTVK